MNTYGYVFIPPVESGQESSTSEFETYTFNENSGEYTLVSGKPREPTGTLYYFNSNNQQYELYNPVP